MAKIAFDIDDTLYKIVEEEFVECSDCAKKPGTPVLCNDCVNRRLNPKYKQVPDYDLINVLRWFVKNGDEVFIWSAGGEWYAQKFVNDFGLEGVVVIGKMHTDKEGNGTGMPIMDIAFDDCETRLAKVDIRVKRYH